MSFEIRFIKSSEYDTAKQMWNICFPGDENGFSDHYFEKRTGPQNVLALFEDGIMKASLHILRQTECFFDTEKEIGFIAGVATLPLYRHKGLANNLLKESFSIMRSSGLSAAMLQPFSHDFYRRSGFETFVCRKIYTLKNTSRTKFKKTFLRETSAKRMLEIYNQFMSRFSGYKKRNVKDFEFMLDEAVLTGCLAIESDVAYAFCEVEGNTAIVTELAGENMLSLMISLQNLGFETVRFPLPENICLSHLEFDIEPFNMLRILDVAGFLEGIPANDGEFVFDVTDYEIAGNSGRYRIKAEGHIIRRTEKITGEQNCQKIDAAGLMQSACGVAELCESKFLRSIFSSKTVNYAFERY